MAEDTKKKKITKQQQQLIFTGCALHLAAAVKTKKKKVRGNKNGKHV